jgi:5-methylcytosine-specific restriction protein B
MPYFTSEHLSHALKVLPEQTHQSLVSFLAMLRKNVPLSNTPSQVFGSAQEGELLDDYFRPPGGPQERPWYLPFGKLAAGLSPWKPKKYAGASLQRIRTGKQQFLYKQGTGTSNDLWSLDPNMIPVLAARHKEVVGEIPISIHNLATWCYRAIDVASHQVAIDTFIEEFNLLKYGLVGSIFERAPDPALAGIPLSPTPLTDADVLKLLEPPPTSTSAGTGPLTPAAAAEDEPTWDVDIAEIKAAISGLEGIEEAAYRAIAALRAGMNVIFTGPPGTGKTQLAQRLCEASTIPWTMTAATDQWTTIDTIGGYLPSATTPNSLDFQPGFVTAAIQSRQTLIIDEINRADIDKAFGELFTLLSGNNVDLPYLHRDPSTGGTRRIRLATEATADDPQFETIRIPNWWRLIGSMNDADKASLKRLSYAFIRRFAFVPVPIPTEKVYAALIDAGAGEGATGLKTQNPQFLGILKALFVDASGLPSFEMAMGYAIPEALMRHARGELALNPTLTTVELLISALDLFLAPQFQGRAEKHEALMDLLGQHLKDATVLEAFGKRLAVWTGFVP